MSSTESAGWHARAKSAAASGVANRATPMLPPPAPDGFASPPNSRANAAARSLQPHAARRPTQLEQGIALNLADALACNIEVPAYLFQRVFRLLADAVSHP